MLRSLFFMLTLSTIVGFDFITGVFRVHYPRKKMIRFTPENNEIIEKRLLVVKFHPPQKRYYVMHDIDSEEHLFLSNLYNSSDVLLLTRKG